MSDRDIDDLGADALPTEEDAGTETGPPGEAEAPSERPWQERLQAYNLNNIIDIPPKLHIRKHVSESILQYVPFLLNIFIPLFTEILPYAKKKWQKIENDLAKVISQAEKNAEAAAAVLEDADADPATKMQAQRDVERHLSEKQEASDAQELNTVRAPSCRVVSCCVV